jgi:hypothetical protein
LDGETGSDFLIDGKNGKNHHICTTFENAGDVPRGTFLEKKRRGRKQECSTWNNSRNRKDETVYRFT